MSSSTSSTDEDDAVSSSEIEDQVRQSLHHFCVAPDILEVVVEIAKENPVVCGAKAKSLVDMLEETHGYARSEGWNMGLLLEAIHLEQPSSVRRRVKNREKSKRGSTQSEQDINGKALKRPKMSIDLARSKLVRRPDNLQEK